jgi:hypothetical protein
MYGWLALESGTTHAGRHALAEARCGLCARFGGTFRTRTRWLASTDPSLLLLLVDALSPDPLPRTRVRCPLTLKLGTRPALSPEDPRVAAVAALQLVLAGEKLLDDQLDREGLLARLAASLLAPDVARATAALTDAGFPVAALQTALRAQTAREQDPGSDLDALTAPTGEGLGHIAAWLAALLGLPAGEVGAARAFGHSLGSVIYVMDALHDRPRDRARGHFNPIDAALGHLSPRRLRFLAHWTEALLARHAACFAHLPLRRHAEPLAGALVTGPTRLTRAALATLSPRTAAAPCLASP